MSEPEMVRRQRALQKTVERFRHKPFALGKQDCVQLARAHLVAMGHRKLPSAAGYSSAVAGARKLAAAIGKLTGKRPRQPHLEQLLDALLPRIAAAAMLPGDIALLEPEGPAEELGSIGIAASAHKLMAYHPDHFDKGLVFVEVTGVKAAWRA